MSNPREELHNLIDELSYDDLVSLLHLLKRIIISDEELTEHEIQEIELAKQQISNGEYMDIEEVKSLFAKDMEN